MIFVMDAGVETLCCVMVGLGWVGSGMLSLCRMYGFMMQYT